MLLIFSDTTDNILYTFARKWHAKRIDLFSMSDAIFPKDFRMTQYIRRYVNCRISGGLSATYVFKHLAKSFFGLYNN